jgi:phosphoglycolate phosphatase-like HAD superfamily hydrolase
MNLAVFDLDGTLIQHLGADEQCFVQAFADAYGIAQLDRTWNGYEHVTDSWVIREVYKVKYRRPPDNAEIQRYIDCYLQLLVAKCSNHGRVRPIPGAEAFLAEFNDRNGWRCAIATGGWQRAARFKMMAAELVRSDLPLACAEDGLTREDIVRAAIDRACASYGIGSFDRVVLVGDALWDVRTAQSLELPFVGVGSGQDAEKLFAQGATHVIGDFLNTKHVVSCLEQAGVPGV